MKKFFLWDTKRNYFNSTTSNNNTIYFLNNKKSITIKITNDTYNSIKVLKNIKIIRI